MASFPYNSSSLLFQQLHNISPSTVEEATAPSAAARLGTRWEQNPASFGYHRCKVPVVHPGKLQVPGNHQVPPEVRPLVNIQCHRAALTGWDPMKQKWIFRKSITDLCVPITNDAWSPSLLVNRTLLPQPVPTKHIWAYFPVTPLLFQTSRFHFSSSIQHYSNSIEILIHHTITALISYMDHKCVQHYQTQNLGFSPDHKHP